MCINLVELRKLVHKVYQFKDYVLITIRRISTIWCVFVWFI